MRLSFLLLGLGYLDDLLLIDSEDVFHEQNGQVMIEAEQFHQDINRNNQQWLTQTVMNGYTGISYVQVKPDIDAQYTTGYTTTSPELQFQLTFVTTGTYHVWIRGYAPNAAGDSLHMGLDETTPAILTGFAPRQWSWANRDTQGGVATIEVVEPGLHTLRIRPREDGMRLDRILLTLDSGYNPDGAGPSESQRF